MLTRRMGPHRSMSTSYRHWPSLLAQSMERVRQGLMPEQGTPGVSADVEAMADSLPTLGVAARIAEQGLNDSQFAGASIVTEPGS
jgi:hypothetical protein